MPRYSATDGASLYFDQVPPRDDGDGEGEEPIIVLAGGAARHPVYLGDLAGIGQNRQLVIPHLRGVGESNRAFAAEAASSSYWRQASDIEQMRVHLGLAKVTIVAHSAGTRLAVAYAAQYGDRVESLVLITPPVGYLLDLPTDAASIAERRSNDASFVAARVVYEAGPALDSDNSFTEWNRSAAPVSYAAWGEKEAAHALRGTWNVAAAQSYFAIEPPLELRALLRRLDAPVLVIAGAEDYLTGFEPVAALAELFRNGETAVIERCGHYPWVEQPQSFRRAVDNFLGRAAAAARSLPA